MLYSKCPRPPGAAGPGWEPAHSPSSCSGDTPSPGSAAASSRCPGSRLRPRPRGHLLPEAAPASHGRCAGPDADPGGDGAERSAQPGIPAAAAPGWHGAGARAGASQVPAETKQVAAEPGQSARLWLARLSAPPAAKPGRPGFGGGRPGLRRRGRPRPGLRPATPWGQGADPARGSCQRGLSWGLGGRGSHSEGPLRPPPLPRARPAGRQGPRRTRPRPPQKGCGPPAWLLLCPGGSQLQTAAHSLSPAHSPCTAGS